MIIKDSNNTNNNKKILQQKADGNNTNDNNNKILCPFNNLKFQLTMNIKRKVFQLVKGLSNYIQRLWKIKFPVI